MTDKMGADDLVAQGATAADLAALPRAKMGDPLVVLDGLEPNPPPEVLGARLRAMRGMLDGADPLDRALLRDLLIRRLEILKVRSPAALADAVLVTDQAGEDLQGRPLALADPDPWPESVDGAQLAESICEALAVHVILPEGGADALTLWVLHTYTLEVAEASPIMTLTSPVRRCGKTRALTILDALCRRPLSAANISAAALFRTVEKFAPTLLIDEADTALATSDELRALLNSGHTRATAWVVRTVGDDHEPRRFSTWGPKAIALIGKLPGTTEDRSIVLQMWRRRKTEQIRSLRLDRLRTLCEPLVRKAARWAQDHLGGLRRIDPAVPEELDDRAQDNWRPLLAIADLVGGVWPARARKAALLLSGAAQREEDAIGVELLADVRQVFECRRVDRLASSVLVEELIAMEERPWREWGKRGKPLTQRRLAALLKSFGIVPKSIRVDGSASGQVMRGYELAQFQDAFSRYLPPFDPLQPLRANENEDLPLENDPLRDSRVADRKVELTPRKHSSVALVADRIPLVEGKEGAAWPAEPCYACGARRFWRSKAGRVICATCHPPASPEAVAEVWGS